MMRSKDFSNKRRAMIPQNWKIIFPLFSWSKKYNVAQSYDEKYNGHALDLFEVNNCINIYIFLLCRQFREIW